MADQVHILFSRYAYYGGGEGVDGGASFEGCRGGMVLHPGMGSWERPFGPMAWPK
jgi:hypothetical protein